MAQQRRLSLQQFMSKSFFNYMGSGLILLLFAAFSAGLTGCANIQSPMGGPRDSLPPKLIKASPAENAVNFSGHTIRFEFDEFVQLDNASQNLLINPSADNYPIVQSKLRTVTIKIKDTLQPNTTYTYNFGNAIKDVNENNAFKDFSYSFSTGAYIDSLTLDGLVLNAETGLPDSTLIVILHSQTDDSAVAKEKPRFITRLDGKGTFHFDHLPADSFSIFAIKDEALRRYSSNSIPFAFLNRRVSTRVPDSLITLRFFTGEKEPEKRPASTNTGGKKKTEEKLRYTTSLEGSEQDILSPLSLMFSKPVDTVDFSKMILTDTLFQPLGDYKWIKDANDTTGKTYQLKLNWKDDFHYQLLLSKGFATDTSGTAYAKTDTLVFKTKPESQYGSVKIKFKGLEISQHPLLQWILNEKVIESIPLTSSEYRVKLFRPGQYRLRIVQDANQNGVWDTGNYWKKLQPEMVTAVEQLLNVKANWENEFDVNL